MLDENKLQLYATGSHFYTEFLGILAGDFSQPEVMGKALAHISYVVVVSRYLKEKGVTNLIEEFGSSISQEANPLPLSMDDEESQRLFYDSFKYTMANLLAFSDVVEPTTDMMELGFHVLAAGGEVRTSNED